MRARKKFDQYLLEAVSRIDRPGTFCASGHVPVTLPGLTVAGVGMVGLPLVESQAKQLIQHARQAPYGKGTKTVVDTNVRRVWEIDAGRVTFANPDWSQVVDQAIDAVREQLGLADQQLTAHLYKLLIYEPGGFFLPHRDGEKLDRMVGTLVIALPSEHEGGQLLIRHEGKEVAIDFGGASSAFDTQYAAFYADCEHEVKPVTKGYRLALTYNLTLGRQAAAIGAPRLDEQVATLQRLLSDWRSEEDTTLDEDESPAMLAVLLDHRYSEAGLTFDALKGVDHARAQALLTAASQAGCDAYLALITRWQLGTAEDDYDHYYSRRGRHGNHEPQGPHTMGEIIEESCTAEHFIDPSGQPVPLGVIPVDEGQIISRKPMDAGKPDEEDFEDYTGNAGMTLERWYHRAAVVIWPSTHRFAMLCAAGMDSAVGGLQQMVKQWQQAAEADRAAMYESCVTFAKVIIARWPQSRFVPRNEENSIGKSLLALLVELDTPQLVGRWITQVMGRDVAADPGSTLTKACRKYGWSAFADELTRVFAATADSTLARHVTLLASMATTRDKNKDRMNLCATLAGHVLTAVQTEQPNERRWFGESPNHVLLVRELTRALTAMRADNLLEQFISHMEMHTDTYRLTEVVVPAFVALEPWLTKHAAELPAPLHHWLERIAARLKSRVDDPPIAPRDWRRDASITCTCADCGVLRRFLDDPDQSETRLPLAQHRRDHLQQCIRSNQLDVACAVERKGRPFTLVCTKTQASYKRAVKSHQTDQLQHEQIRDMLDHHATIA